ncbi:hypothetical protein C0Q57_05975 [Streptomyces albidoflavus]|uniref:hypothetical protein n=1 Tax=Streptomyces albidoflavus TaxID=1886 RepID=UPI00101F844E|nr:hypothetical protein [Streptomyces albidoflavus]RZD71844.1 hypothetical protein C0Q57_05975 [Streptomyces albidoflavus]
MAHSYYLYGSKSLDLQAARDNLAASLGISFSCRESDFKGGEYYLARRQGFEKLTIEANWMDEDGEFVEQDFPDFPVLVYVSNPVESVQSILDGENHLQRLRGECID